MPITLEYTVASARKAQKSITTLLDGSPVTSIVDHLMVELTIEGVAPMKVPFPPVPNDDLAAELADFAPGAIVEATFRMVVPPPARAPENETVATDPGDANPRLMEKIMATTGVSLAKDDRPLTETEVAAAEANSRAAEEMMAAKAPHDETEHPAG